MARNPRLAPVSSETAAVIDLMLQNPDPATVKNGLQRACELLESGSAFLETTFLGLALEKHLRSEDLKVRRWSYKLAGRLSISGGCCLSCWTGSGPRGA